MIPCISLHILELGINAQDAGAKLVEIALDIGDDGGTLRVKDDGRGMCEEELKKCLIDGYSTKGTDGIGLGKVKRASKKFDIVSTPGEGTCVTVTYGKDFMLGHIDASIVVLLANESDLTLELNIKGKRFNFDTRTLEEEVGDKPRMWSVKAVKNRINHFIELNGGAML